MKIVSDQGPHRPRWSRGASGSPSPISCAQARPLAQLGSSCVVSATRDTSTAPPATKQTAFVANGSRLARRRIGTRRSAAQRAGWSARKAPCIRAVGRCRGRRAATMHRAGACSLAESANVSAVPRMNSVTRTTPMATVPLTIVATRTTSAAGPPEVGRDDHPPTVEAIRGGAAQDAEAAGSGDTRSGPPATRGTDPW